MAASGMLDEVATALEALERVLQHGSDLAGYRDFEAPLLRPCVPYNFEQEERVLRFTMPLPGNTPITRLNVTVRDASLEAGVHGQPSIVKGSLYQPVLAKEANWTIASRNGWSALVVEVPCAVALPWEYPIKGGILPNELCDGHSAYLRALSAFQHHDYARGIEWLQQAATRHHGQALLHLAKLYESGHSQCGVAKSSTRFVQTLIQAAQCLEEEALIMLGQQCQQLDTKEGLDLASRCYELVLNPNVVRWAAHCQLRRADRQFSPSFAIAAYLRASNLLNESIPEEADVAAQRQRAVKLLNVSGAQGCAPAYAMLGRLYAEGEVLPMDVALAERYNRSARALDPTMAVASNAGSAHGSATPLSRSAVTSARATPSHDAAARNSPAVRPSHARRPETAETARQLEFTPEDTAEAMDEDLLDAVKQRAMMILGVGAAVFGLVVMHMRR